MVNQDDLPDSLRAIHSVVREHVHTLHVTHIDIDSARAAAAYRSFSFAFCLLGGG